MSPVMKVAYIGVMHSQKTSKLLEVIEEKQNEKNLILAPKTCERVAWVVDGKKKVEFVTEVPEGHFDNVFIDEYQFWDGPTDFDCDHLYVAGLSYDFKHTPFNYDGFEITELTTKCEFCDNDAFVSMRGDDCVEYTKCRHEGRDEDVMSLKRSQYHNVCVDHWPGIFVEVCGSIAAGKDYYLDAKELDGFEVIREPDLDPSPLYTGQMTQDEFQEKMNSAYHKAIRECKMRSKGELVYVDSNIDLKNLVYNHVHSGKKFITIDDYNYTWYNVPLPKARVHQHFIIPEHAIICVDRVKGENPRNQSGDKEIDTNIIIETYSAFKAIAERMI